MKIISKYKDFYDFLIGKYGIDPKIVLDRRNHNQPDLWEPTALKLYICDNVIDGFFDGKNFYYGDDLSKIGELEEMRKKSFYFRTDLPDILYYIKYNDLTGYERTVNLDPKIKKTNLNKKKDCPIMLYTFKDDWFGAYTRNKNEKIHYMYPKLKDLDVSSIFSPEEIFQMLTQWLSNRNQEKENIVDNRNNTQKLESKGFDKKRSFRPKMKK